ncbi:hypothetical protein PMAYCL1PPCAC_30303 [Pristionchus mayeri]|uniref:LRAT domain-containing protein n=1 Tax=Pristionchus mayeri TaxID=1317129 RepID=A0AAN5DAT5_9BILA|nr:hypothetical protein PMAYCL1PPCAC_30301 [Pristionchus mayeri]GMR60108.1 hypothetical protein PMAYCL1PPCAC_30303 [Pristionchus mayeri]
MESTDLVSSYMNWKDLATILKPGDLIEFSRGNSGGSGGAVYQHWAVYMGVYKRVHQVIHYSNEDLSDAARRTWGNFIEVSGNVEVQWELLEKVACGCPCRKNNGWDAVDIPRKPEEIVETAKKMVGDVGYCLATNNCEHFSNFCRYGKKRSGQVSSTVTAAGVISVVGGVLVAAYAAGKAVTTALGYS